MFYNDKYWVEAINAVNEICGSVSQVFGPSEFYGFVHNLLPLEYMEAYPNLVEAFCCPKDDADLLRKDVLHNLDTYSCLFANEVFVIYIHGLYVVDDRIKPLIAEHSPYFLDKVDRIRRGLAIRESRLNPRFPVGDFSPSFKGKRVLVINASNMGNFGDEILAWATVEICRSIMPGAQIIVSEPQIDRSFVANADYIVLGGGGVLYDFAPGDRLPDLRNISNYFRFAFYAFQEHISFAVLGLGHQEQTPKLISSAAISFLKEAFQRTSFITTRDADTVRLIQGQLSQPGSATVMESGDLSLYVLTPVPRTKRDIRSLTFVGYIPNGSLDIYASMLDILAEAGVSIRVAVQANEDVDVAEGLRRMRPGTVIEAVDMRDMPAQEGVEILRDTDAVVTSRFHSSIMALTGGLPTIMIDHENGKKERLAESVFGERASDVLVRPDDLNKARTVVRNLIDGSLPIATIASLNTLCESTQVHVAAMQDFLQCRERED